MKACKASTSGDFTRRAKERAEHTLEGAREPFAIGCHAHSDILLLAEPLGRMRERFPNFYPVFHAVPFQRLCQRLGEEAVEVDLAREVFAALPRRPGG